VDILQFAILGAASGGIIALLALGINVVYRATGVINFSHAATAIATAYVYSDLSEVLPTPLALILCVVAGIAFGALIEFVIMRPLRHASTLTRAIATIGILICVQAGLGMRYGFNPVIVPSWLPNQPIEIGDFTVGLDRLLVIVIVIVVAAALFSIYRWTPFGLASTALSVSPRSLAALGHSPARISMLNWIVAGGLASLGGLLLAPITVLNPYLALILVVPVLSAALLGRLSSFWLTVLGGVGIGIAQALLGRAALFQGATEVLPLLVIAIVLSIRGSALPRRGEDAEALPTIGSGRIPWVAVLVVGLLLVLAVSVLLPLEWVTAVSVGLATAVVLVSIVVVTGYAGQLSLASFALAGVAALVSGQLVATFGWPFALAALTGIAATIPVGLIIGLPAIRTRGTSLAIITLGFAVALQSAVFNNSAISGGFSGLVTGPIELFDIPLNGVFQPRNFGVMVALAFVLVGILTLRLRRSPAGLRMVAVRGNERAAASLGVSVALTKLRAFVTSAVIAGVGGVLLAFSNYAIVLGNPGGRFDPLYSLNAIAQTTLGGIGFVSGTAIGTISEPGAVVAKLLAFLASGPTLSLISGLLLLITVVTAPSGVVPNVLAAGHALASRFPGAAQRQARAERRAEAARARDLETESTVGGLSSARLEVEALTVVFGATRALDGVSLVVEPGRVLGVIGPNGAGKTTLVDAMTGYSPVRTGQVRLDGAEITRRPPHTRARLGVVRSFQSLEVFEDLTLRQNLLVASDASSWLRTLFAGVLPERTLMRSRPCAYSISKIVSTRRPPHCRSASAACWPSHAPSRRVREYFCSMNLLPACRAWNGTSCAAWSVGSRTSGGSAFCSSSMTSSSCSQCQIGSLLSISAG
jgi:branched-subunit amino acid ABC-type transport system permease component